MTVTGITFDMNPKTFTLGKLFEMNLDQFEEQINEICSGAQKELTIESGINQIADTWRVQRFDVIKYMKGTQERGTILRSTEEIQQTLEDQVRTTALCSRSGFT
jgi:dynein heavy chain